MASHLNSADPRINIGGDPHDGSYRYKMPQIVVQHQRNSTIFPNIADVAKALKVQPQWLVQYFTYRFGLRGEYDAKSKVASLLGQHGEADVRRYRDQFIAQFVLCPKCGLAEAHLHPERELVKIDCAACGRNRSLVLTSKGDQASFDKMVKYFCSQSAQIEADANKAKKEAKRAAKVAASSAANGAAE